MPQPAPACIQGIPEGRRAGSQQLGEVIQGTRTTRAHLLPYPQCRTQIRIQHQVQAPQRPGPRAHSPSTISAVASNHADFDASETRGQFSGEPSTKDSS